MTADLRVLSSPGTVFSCAVVSHTYKSFSTLRNQHYFSVVDRDFVVTVAGAQTKTFTVIHDISDKEAYLGVRLMTTKGIVWCDARMVNDVKICAIFKK